MRNTLFVSPGRGFGMAKGYCGLVSSCWKTGRCWIPAGCRPRSCVGRTLATPSTAATSTPSPSYFVGEVENNQVTITYTVYNEQADPETGVLLTTTLEPGVTFVSSSVTLDGTTTTQLPDQSGQNLAWSLGTIQGYDRESVALTVMRWPSSDPDRSSTPARRRSPRSTPAPSRPPRPPRRCSRGTSPTRACSPRRPMPTRTTRSSRKRRPRSITTRQQIFNFLHTQIGYNSYLGSVRGARGTLWSSCRQRARRRQPGRGLDARLGHPGAVRLGDAVAERGPAADPVDVPGPAIRRSATSRPARRPPTRPTTRSSCPRPRSHYWFQFDTGSGMQDADPLMAGATIGQTFTTSTGTFTAVPDDLEADDRGPARRGDLQHRPSALFGLERLAGHDRARSDVRRRRAGGPAADDRQFRQHQRASALIFTATTNTYTPYIEMGDEAYPDSSQDEVITGTPYQEVLTNFPLGARS